MGLNREMLLFTVTISVGMFVYSVFAGCQRFGSLYSVSGGAEWATSGVAAGQTRKHHQQGKTITLSLCHVSISNSLSGMLNPLRPFGAVRFSHPPPPPDFLISHKNDGRFDAKLLVPCATLTPFIKVSKESVDDFLRKLCFVTSCHAISGIKMADVRRSQWEALNTGWPIKNAPSLEACQFTLAIDRNPIICTQIELSILRWPLKFCVDRPSVLQTMT